MLPGTLCHAQGNLNSWDVEGMYAQAKATLEDRSIRNVEGVPMLLETCAREGHVQAALLLMDVYEGHFKGLEARPEQACHLTGSMAQAAALDKKSTASAALRTEAMYRHALNLEKGYGCTANPAEAYQWMNRAAERGMGKACVELARYLITGIGHAPRPEKAWKLLHRQALEAPNTPHLFFYMGHMCAEGIGMRRNPRKAWQLFCMGAKMDDAQCLNNLGAMYERGNPTHRDTELALQLYRKAAYLGNKEASANMQRLAFKLGIRALRTQKESYTLRIRNATKRIIAALPLDDYLRQRLEFWLLPLRDDEPA